MQKITIREKFEKFLRKSKIQLLVNLRWNMKCHNVEENRIHFKKFQFF